MAADEGCRAALILLAVLQICFYPCFWSGKTLLASAEEAPSILHDGADTGPPTNNLHFHRIADAGAAAWQTEPWLAFIGDQYREGTIPLWNPYQAYGGPLAANMQSQPFYPLTFLLALRLTPRTYNFYILARLFVAGIFTYFYLRLFLSFTSAIAGGIVSMLTGYYILYITMPHLSVEVLLPAVLLAGECLLKRKNHWGVLWLAIAVMLVVLGGMPESALLLLTFATAYLLFRIFSDTELRREWKQSVVMLLLSAVAGAGLSCFLLFPFYEYMTHSSNSHAPPLHPGLWADKLDLSALTYFFPLLFGPPYSSSAFVADQLRNYVGLLSVFLIVIAVAAMVGGYKNRDLRLNAMTCFFAVSAILMILKKYGCFAVNWVGWLPYYGLIEFRKYDEPILAFSIWVLCAIAIERLRRRQVNLAVQAIALGIASLMLIAAVILSKSPIPVPFGLSKLAIRLPAILLALLLLGIITGTRTRKPLLSILVAALMTVELSANYVIPVYRVYGRPPTVRRNPYQGGAFVRFLESKSEGDYRVFGRDWVLTPSWASVFGIFDIRDMDGLYYKKYFPFLNNYIGPQNHEPTDLVSCFFGNGAYDFRAPLERRLLQLSSVRYLATPSPYAASCPRIDEILQQNQGRLPPDVQNHVGRTDLILNGTAREGLGEHPPCARLPYRLKVGDRQSKFHFSYGLNPAVFSVTVGDGVGFTIEVRNPSGQIEKLFSQYIDPKHNVAERRWMDEEIDLSRYRGQEITLLFSTDPGPRGDSSFDWAAWSDLRFEDEPQQPAPPFRLVYDAETKIYEYDNVLPRAAIYYDADIEPDETAVLRKLADPSIDVFRTVVLDASKLSKSEAARVEMKSPERVEAARITSYQSQHVEIEAKLNRSGILVLNDSNYPGWRVSVDGQPSDWFQANYLFRGVLLSSGTHVVRFQYRPASFYWGAGISLLTLGVLSIFGMLLIFRPIGRRKDIARELPQPS